MRKHEPERLNTVPPLPKKAKFAPLVTGLRGLPLDGDPPERRYSAPPLSTALNLVMRHYQLGKPPTAMLQNWEEIVGADLAGKIRPGKFENGILYIYAPNSTVVFELRRYKMRQLDKALRKHPDLPGLRQIRLQIDPDK